MKPVAGGDAEAARARRPPPRKQPQRSAARARRPVSDHRERRGGCWQLAVGAARARKAAVRGEGASRLTRAAAPRPGLWPVDEERRAPKGAFEVEALWLDEREEEEKEKEAAEAPCGPRAEETMLMESGG